MNSESMKNPWLSIWFKPQKTILSIIGNDPKKMVPDLAVIGGMAFALEKAFDTNAGDQVGLITILLGCILGGAMNGWIFLYLTSAIVLWTGKWLKGRATVEHIRAALSWSCIPIVCSIAPWIIVIALFRLDLFRDNIITIQKNLILEIVFYLFIFSILILKFRFFIIFIRCLGQVQKFSLWKSFLNLLVSGSIVLIPILFIVFIYILASKGYIS